MILIPHTWKLFLNSSSSSAMNLSITADNILLKLYTYIHYTIISLVVGRYEDLFTQSKLYFLRVKIWNLMLMHCLQ